MPMQRLSVAEGGGIPCLVWTFHQRGYADAPMPEQMKQKTEGKTDEQVPAFDPACIDDDL